MSDAQTTSLYNNVTCIILSQDHNNETWVHFAVELQGKDGDRQPYLSTFGEAIINAK